MMEYLRNAWYVAAWDDEVTDAFLPRMLLNERVLFYRSEAGDPIAIGNVCPHRFAQLHMGLRVGDIVECGYHGLRFDRTGACVFNPHGNGTIPAGARVKSYPVEERHAAIWIWMGDPARANPMLIPNYGHLADPGQRTIRGMKHMSANYQLLIDNLMDASHSQFLHANLIANPAFLRGKQTVSREEDTVDIRTWIPDGEMPYIYRHDLDPSVKRVDMWVDFHWDAPAALLNHNGVTPAGEERSAGVEKHASHFVTPESDTSTHYFYAHTRSKRLDDPAVDESVREWQRVAFGDQDKPMIEGCQEAMGDADFDALKPVMLVSDAGAVRVRRVLGKLINAERAGSDLEPSVRAA